MFAVGRHNAGADAGTADKRPGYGRFAGVLCLVCFLFLLVRERIKIGIKIFRVRRGDAQNGVEKKISNADTPDTNRRNRVFAETLSIAF